MWFGTKDGLNRYDGYDFIVYRNNAFDSTSISENHITTLYEDHQGQMWVGTRKGELNQLQRKTETFQRWSLPSRQSGLFNPYPITAIAEDSLGYLWVGTRGNGLYRIPSRSGNDSLPAEIIQIVHEPGNPGSLSDDTIYALWVDSQGMIWIGTNKGLDKYNPRNSLPQFEHFSIYTRNPRAPLSPRDSSILSIYVDSRERMWLGTPGGICRFQPTSGQFEFYPHHYEIYRYGWGQVTAIMEDPDGRLWIATPGELMRFDPLKKKYDYFRSNPANSKSISYNGISSLYRDRSGVLWFGTPGAGINITDPKTRRFSTLIHKPNPSSRLSGFSVRSVFEDNTGNLWISSDVLFRWNRTTGELKSFETSSDRLYDFGNTGVFSLIQTSRGEMWAATTEGLYRYYPLTGEYRRFSFNPPDTTGLRQKAVFTVFEDRDHHVWIVSENYLSKLLDAETGRFRHYRYNPAPPQEKFVRPVLYQDDWGIFWMGTDNGLLRFDPSEESFTAFRNNPTQSQSLSNNSVISICPDVQQPDGILWLGTDGGGLNSFDKKRATFAHFTEKDGLPNNVVYGILPDERGNLWLSTNKGLSQFNPQSKGFKNYDVRDGLPSNEFNTGAYFRSKSGELFFGGISGLTYFYPHEVKDNHVIPQIVITGFKLKNHPVSLQSENSLLKQSISETEHLVLPHRENVITFDFAALDFSVPEKNRFAYKLENFNHDWIETSRERSATYTNLPPGEYTFRVKGTNNDGVWNEAEAFLKLTITPPWWKTSWAYTLYIVATLLILWGIRRYELNRIGLKNRLKIGRIEATKLKELDQLKSRFFTNISHEFRTPLTLILGQIESVMSSKIQNKEKSKLQIALRNSHRLLSLINQLLDLSRLEAGSLELKAETHNLVSFLKSIFYSFESLAEQKHIRLSFYSEEKEFPVSFEPEKMERIFYNLMSNALKFTPKGGEIQLTCDRYRPAPMEMTSSRNTRYPAGEFVRIRIKDNGIGISEKELPHIFDRFFQVDSFHTREHEGTGIGLALTKELVDLHQGFISVYSQEGKGTTFTILLPLGEKALSKEESVLPARRISVLDKEAESPPPLREPSHPTPTARKGNGSLENKTPPSNLKSEIVLIVEDHPDVRSYIREQLEKDYTVIEASDGEEGISRAQEIIPDVIISDVMMPRMDGFEFSRKIRQGEKTSHIPLILLTARATLNDKIEGLELGADAYLTKPFSARELQVRVKSLIRQRQQLRRRFSKATVIKPSEVTAVSIDQVFLQKVVAAVEESMEEEGFNVEKLALMINMSTSQLNRKLGALIDQPAGQLIRSMRLQRAADLLKQNSGTVAEICYRVGFGDQANFTRAFKKQFGVAPGVFKKQQPISENR
ncbi:MAG: two-component regulator propeller domain-containing protein [Calditrichia bacterium]